MNQTFRVIAAVGIIIILVAGSALFVINRSRQRQIANATPTPGPLFGTPSPTFIPFGSGTPFPLITFGSPNASPVATGSAKPSTSPSGTQAPVFACTYLTAQPGSGVAPLSVRFTAAGFGTSGSNIREYEFIFGDGSTSVRQASASATHRYEKMGNFVASLRVRDASGNIISLPGGECQRSINVILAATPASTATPSGQLPQTGPEEWLWLSILPLIAAGAYVYRRFRLI